MLSVRNMLTDERKQYTRPSILNISSLLCSVPSDPQDSLYRNGTTSNNTFDPNYYRGSYGQNNMYLQEVSQHHEHSYYTKLQPQPQPQHKRSLSESKYHYSNSISSSPQRTSSLPSLSPPASYHLLDKRYRRSSRQHQIESKKIEQELLQQAAAEQQQHQHKQNTDYVPVKAKRRRASSKQLDVLNKVFERTFFPSTQLRAELGRQLGMSPRTVQIWFQNKRQAIRTRERSSSTSLSTTSTSSRESSVSLD